VSHPRLVTAQSLAAHATCWRSAAASTKQPSKAWRWH